MKQRQRCEKEEQGGGLRNRARVVGGSEVGEYGLVLRADCNRLAGITAAEVGREVDEIGDGDAAVVINIALLPGGIRRAEMGCQLDEVGDGDDAVEIQIADAGGTDEQGWIAVGVGNGREAEGRVGMSALT